MNIGEFIRRTRPDPDGGIGGLTPDEETELSDLLNGPHKACTCEGACCGKTPREPRSHLL